MKGFGMTIGEIASAVGGTLLRGDSKSLVTGYEVDSRRVSPGNMFFALPGARADGYDYIADANARGASGAVFPRGRAIPEGISAEFALIESENTLSALIAAGRAVRERSKVIVVGITGSVGKTTAKDMLAAIVETKYRTFKSPANFNTEIGLPIALSMLEPDIEVAVFEMAMRGRGQIELLSDTAKPDHAIITNVKSAHIGLLGSREEIAKAKLEICTGLSEEGSLWLNMDDAPFNLLISGDEDTAAGLEFDYEGEVRTFSLGSEADVFVRDIRLLGLAGSSFSLSIPNGCANVSLPLLGKGAIACAAAVAGVAWKLGFGAGEIAAALKSVRPVPGRFSSVDAGDIHILDDSYNAGPDSVLNALGVLRSIQLVDKLPVGVVLGDMLELGDLADLEHERVGRALSALSPSFAIIGGDSADAVQKGSGAPAWLDCVKPSAPGSYNQDFIERVLAAFWGKAERVMNRTVVLVKASRSVGLDRFIEAITAKDQNAGVSADV